MDLIENELLKKLKDEEKENEFQFADRNQEIRKKPFDLIAHFQRVMQNILHDEKSLKFMFLSDDLFCISLHYLFLKISEKYTLKELDNKFDIEKMKQIFFKHNVNFFQKKTKRGMNLKSCLIEINGSVINSMSLCFSKKIFFKKDIEKLDELNIKKCKIEKKSSNDNSSANISDEDILKFIKEELKK